MREEILYFLLLQNHTIHHWDLHHLLHRLLHKLHFHIHHHYIHIHKLNCLMVDQRDLGREHHFLLDFDILYLQPLHLYIYNHYFLLHHQILQGFLVLNQGLIGYIHLHRHRLQLRFQKLNFHHYHL